MSSRPMFSAAATTTDPEDRPDSPFTRSLGTTPNVKHWQVNGRSRYTGHLAVILTYRTKEEARDAVRELRRDYGEDMTWANPVGPLLGRRRPMIRRILHALARAALSTGGNVKW